MRKKTIYPIVVIVLFCTLPKGVSAQMQSSNYELTTSVLSGGGVSMASDNFSLYITAAQPSPIRETRTPPESDNFVLYPGFWYTLDPLPKKKKVMPWIPLLLDDE